MSQMDGSNRSLVTLSARYVPVDIKLEPRESINSELSATDCVDDQLIWLRYGPVTGRSAQCQRTACG